jgi:hypothetical protein
MRDEDDDLLRAAEELGIDLSGVRATEDEVPDAAVIEEGPEAPTVAAVPDDDDDEDVDIDFAADLVAVPGDGLEADLTGVVDTPLDRAALADGLDLKSLDAEDTLDEETA